MSLPASMADSVPCDRLLQKAYSLLPISLRNTQFLFDLELTLRLLRTLGVTSNNLTAALY